MSQALPLIVEEQPRSLQLVPDTIELIDTSICAGKHPQTKKIEGVGKFCGVRTCVHYVEHIKARMCGFCHTREEIDFIRLHLWQDFEKRKQV